jgi:hypothetical protein
MALDFKYAPKFAPMPLAGGGGADKIPPNAPRTATGGQRGIDAPKPAAVTPRSVDATVAAVNSAWRKKLDRTLRRHAHKRMAEERKQFSARLAAYLAEQQPEPIAAPVVALAYDRTRPQRGV